MRTMNNGRLYFSVSNRFSLFLLSVTTLLFEINLTRLFSVSQFYHFAFMIVSLALLGIGASGTFLMIMVHDRGEVDANLRKLSLGTLLSILTAYLVINWIPFDTFNISWDSRQILVLVINFLVLMLPFFFTGMAVGFLLIAFPQEAAKVYAVNLVGSAAGCMLALLAPSLVGGEGIVVLSGCFAACAALFPLQVKEQAISQKIIFGIGICALLLGGMELNAQIFNPGAANFPDLKLSPYKSLSYALQYPDAEIISQKWNSYSRVDVIASDSLRSMPGISFQYIQPPPPERGLFIDGDHFNPVVVEGANLNFTNYLPTALAYQLKPKANTLILEPRGGIDILVAVNEGAGKVTVVEENSLVVSSLPEIYRKPELVHIEGARSALRRSQDQFDLIIMTLFQTYTPVGSGAYSLGENYNYTVEAFQDAMHRLSPDGIFVVSRWLQMPPSEWLRTFILAVSALETLEGNPVQQIVANSKGLRDLAMGFDAGIPIKVIPNGVDTKWYEVNAHQWSPPVLLTVGRLVYQKGIDLLFHSLADIKDLEWKLLIVGDGKDRRNLERLTENFGINDRIEFVGWQSRETLIGYYRHANLYVHPSHDEGMSNAILEAMACGLPVLATGVAGNMEVIVDGSTGRLIPPADSGALRDVLEQLLPDSEVRRAMGQAGRERVVRDFTWQRTSQAYLKILVEILSIGVD